MNRLPITVCIISGAEAHRIGRALDSVRDWVAESVVVLNDSVRDGTEEMAKARGAAVFREPWKGHIAQKNSAAAKATQPWLLGLDADEAVSPELRRSMERIFEGNASPPHAAYAFPRLTQFCGRWIRHGDWYPDHQTRLWKRGAATWGGVDPHDKLLVQGSVGRLDGDLLHYVSVGIDDQISKIVSYSNEFMNDALRQGRPATWFDLAFRPAWRFARAYVLRRGFLDGWQGYYIAWMTAFHSVTRYAKVRLAMEQRVETEAKRPS